MTRNWAAAIALTALLSAGCGSAGSAGSAAPPARPDSIPASTIPSTHPTTTTTTAVTATDGTNLGACADGNCEVQVTGPVTIPVASSLGVGPVSVTAIQTDTVSITIAATAGQVSDNCTGDPSCVPDMRSSFGGGGADATVATATGHAGAMFIVNQLTVDVVTVGTGTAILRLTTG
jgi:hypothetical protein